MRTAVEVTSGAIATDTCCAPLLAAPLPEQEAADLAQAFKALADPVRLRLLSLIAAAAGGEACSCDLEEPVGKSQPTVSHHLSVLADAGLITKRKAGRWVMCRVVPERLDALRAALATA
ncbi:MAG TPA: metalloregulator ArsR/SmtB family transcription factor [Acidimicrobiales bacterium]|nr:metalloregulator ArsR/SmtB family transcription factor [Acidimicrobiales bacterium]